MSLSFRLVVKQKVAWIFFFVKFSESYGMAVDFLHSLRSHTSLPLIVVNDGSRPECAAFFQEIQQIPDCIVLTHAVNLGKGRALKTAFNYYLLTSHDGCGVVTADGDGQHSPEDVIQCAQRLCEERRSLILGVRDFSKNSVPWKSLVGNQLTMAVLSIVLGCRIRDTQTGLRGIPVPLMKQLMNTPGERFEYETKMLLEARSSGFDFLQIPIQTIYLNENRETHFHPFYDSLKIYGVIFHHLFSRIFLFCISGLLSAALDLGLFAVFFYAVSPQWKSGRLFFSVLTARCISMIFNYLFNRNVTFGKTGKKQEIKRRGSFIRYLLLCAAVFLASYSLTKLFNILCHDTEITLIKACIDILLFLVSFFVQKFAIFTERGK